MDIFDDRSSDDEDVLWMRRKLDELKSGQKKQKSKRHTWIAGSKAPCSAWKAVKASKVALGAESKSEAVRKSMMRE